MNPMDPITEEEVAEHAYIVDCDVNPVTHKTCLVDVHQEMGCVEVERRQKEGEDNLYVNGERVVLHRSEKQQKGIVAGNELREELEGMKVLNANILDHLIKNPELYPESWKKDDEGNDLCIPYWGTVYLDFDTKPFVRCSYWQDGKVHSRFKWLTSAFGSTDPAPTLIHFPQ